MPPRGHLLLSAAIVLVGCQARSTSEPSAGGELPDASATPTASPRSPSGGALAIVLRHSAFAHLRPAKTTAAILPWRLDEPARLHGVSVTALDVPSIAAVDRDGVREFGDVVMIPGAESYEELRVLRDARAPTTMRWRVQVDDGLVLRVRERYVEAVDATGRVQVVGNPMFAVDANDVERPVDVRLEGDTLVAHLDTTGLEFPIVVDPLWSTIPNVPAGGRVSYTVITTDDKALVGATNGPPIPHIYNKATNTWTTPSPTFPAGWSNSGTAAVQLTDGRVLFVNGPTAAALRFHPSTYAQTATAAPPTPCGGCALARAGDGRVVKATPGGSALEVYNPTTNSWTSYTQTIGDTAIALTLKDGRVITMGALNQNIYAFNPTTNTVSLLGGLVRMTNPRGLVLADGRVLFVGQINTSGAPPVGTPLFAPATGTFKYTGPISRARNYPAILQLKNGKVLVAGGKDNTLNAPYADAELWNPTTDVWQTIDAMPEARGFPGYGVFSDGSAIIAAGEGLFGNGLITAVIYKPIPDGQPCGLYPIGCDAPYCTDGVCCRSADCPKGTCAAPAGAGRAAGTCALDDGMKCTKNADCASNFCVDGVCCNTACTGQCEACNLAGTVGTCSPVNGRPVAPRSPCGGPGAGTECEAKCNGVNRNTCVYPADKVTCGTDSCTGGVETRVGTCDGAGNCKTTSASCGAYACGLELCKRSCVTDADCAAGHYCGGDQCLPKVGLGSSCTSTSMCPSGLFCTDGVCCGVADCGEGGSCALEPKGTCKKKDGASCTADEECGSGFCTDGVCCNRRCDAQCEACDLPATKGVCSPVSGAPRGTRPPCGGEGCEALECDGAKDPTACTAYKNGGTVVCKPASCDGASLVPASTCDGAGACVTPPVASCGRYACDPASLKCRTDCKSTSDCAPGFSCVAGTCAEGARCSDDGTTSISTDGKEQACAPYICGSAGTCLDNCTKSEDCAPGFVCGSGVCTAVSATTEDDGGGCAASGRAGSTTAGVLVTLAAFAAARRRRQRAA